MVSMAQLWVADDLSDHYSVSETSSRALHYLGTKESIFEWRAEVKQINIWIVLPAIFDRKLRKSKSLVARHYSAVFFLSKASQNNIG